MRDAISQLEKVVLSDRKKARDELIQNIEDLQRSFEIRKSHMKALALRTGHTSQVKTVEAIDTALSVAKARVEKLLKE